MNQFPRMLYKVGGPHEIHGGLFDTLIVENDDELEAALAKGWSATTTEAMELKAAATEVVAPAPAPAPGPAAAPAALPRKEMLAKAKDLGLTHAFNISNAALAELIEAALAKG